MVIFAFHTLKVHLCILTLAVKDTYSYWSIIKEPNDLTGCPLNNSHLFRILLGVAKVITWYVNVRCHFKGPLVSSPCLTLLGTHQEKYILTGGRLLNITIETSTWRRLYYNISNEKSRTMHTEKGAYSKPSIPYLAYMMTHHSWKNDTTHWPVFIYTVSWKLLSVYNCALLRYNISVNNLPWCADMMCRELMSWAQKSKW